MNDERGSWYLLTAIVLGISLGLLYSWAINPVDYVDTPPVSLRAEYKDQYRAVIAAAFEATGDLQRARDRLALLGDEEPSLALVAQAQRYLAEGRDFADAQALAFLASALGQVPSPVPTRPENTATSTPTATETPSPTPTETASATSTRKATDTATATLTEHPLETPTATLTPTNTQTPRPSPTPTSTNTPRPTTTPTATLAPPFVLQNQILVCNPTIEEAQIQVFVANAAGIGIPGVEIAIYWEAGEEHFFTGLKPEIDPGYADFTMEPGVAYTLQVAEGGQLIPDLSAPECTDASGSLYWGSWRLVFTHP